MSAGIACQPVPSVSQVAEKVLVRPVAVIRIGVRAPAWSEISFWLAHTVVVPVAVSFIVTGWPLTVRLMAAPVPAVKRRLQSPSWVALR